MTGFEFRHATAVLMLSAGLWAAPSLAQSATQAKPPATPEPVSGKVVEDIVARVNDQIVTQSDYNRSAEQFRAEAKQQNIPEAQVQQKEADLLRDLVDQQLLLSKGKELGITGETDLIKRLDDIRKQNHLDSLEDLEKAAAQQGVSYEDFKANIRNGIITQQVVRDEVGRRITMSPADVQRYYKAHEAEFAQPESVTLNEILIPTPAKAAGEGADEAQVASAQGQADALEAKLAAGAKFDDLAKPTPTDPLAPKSVALGEFKRGMLAKEIEDKAFALNAGQHTQPIRTKQGFIILQATDRTAAGDAALQKIEPQVQEAYFMEQMQPKLREYLTKLREEAYVEIKPGMTDTGASGNEMRLNYTAYAPPAEKKKKKFARTRFRGRDRSQTRKTATQNASATAPAAAAPVTTQATASTPATTPGQTDNPAQAAVAAPASKPATQQASNQAQSIEKPGKREKIRFGQAPRESLPASQVATANAPESAPPSVATPETRVVNPDGTIAGEAAPVQERKTRLSNRPAVKKVKKPAVDPNQPPAATSDEQASQKVQNSPLGLTDPNAVKKAKEKAAKTRYSDKQETPDTTQPYLGKPANPTDTAPAAQPSPAAFPPSEPPSSPAPTPAGPQQ